MRRPRGPGGRFLTAAEQAAAASAPPSLDPASDPQATSSSTANGYALELDYEGEIDHDHDLDIPEDAHDLGEGWDCVPEEDGRLGAVQ